MARSQGRRSSSVSGRPARILAMFAAGWNASASAKRQPRRPASMLPTVVLPLPDTPATITIIAASLVSRGPAGYETSQPTTTSPASCRRTEMTPVLLGSGNETMAWPLVPSTVTELVTCHVVS